MTASPDIYRNDSEVRADGALINALTGLGTRKSKVTHTRVGGVQLLSQPELNALYSYGLIRRVVDSIADEVTKRLTTVELGDQTIENEIDWLPQFDEFLKQTEFHQAFSEVVKYQRLYGGAGLVLLIDDGLPPEEPVDESRIRAINGYVPLSRYELIPDDVTYIDYSKPTHYRITTSQKLTDDQTESTVNLRIHHSRVARFDGLWLPYSLRTSNTGWGQSVVGSIWYAIKKYWTALDGLGELTEDASLFVHSIPGLFQRIASGNEADLTKRLEANSLGRSVYGGMAIDTEEKVDFLTRNLSGLKDALDPFIAEIQAAMGWPRSILTGESPGGMGKEGRFEERMWASIVENWQENYCRTAVTQVFRYIFLSKTGPTRGAVPKNWKVYFPSTFTYTDKEKAELRLTTAQSDAQYIQLGVLNPIEVRESRFGETEFSIETTLNEAVSQQLITLADQQFQSQLLGYQAQEQAFADPQSEAPAEEMEEEAEPQNATTAGGDAGTQTAQPDNARKTDAYDYYPEHNLRIHITHKLDDISAGHPVAPDGQRIDGSADAPLLILGPHRSRAYKIYRARFDMDGESVDGPYVTAFANRRAAISGITKLFPRQNGVSLATPPPGELENIKAAWGAY